MRSPGILFRGAKLLRRAACPRAALSADRWTPRNDESVIASEAKQSSSFIAAFAGMTLTLIAAALTGPVAAGQEPKYGGSLTYMIPADAPPSFDGHRESTFATVHAAAPFYSVLIRVNPLNPAATTEFVCDLCTEIPQPSDGGKTYTFKIRQ